jgi:hypothetical protein
MATYLQGVTDYIPQYQPFQPDFNFFAGVIQKKQDQYDKNWSKLNTVYGKFLNAPLTREDNIKNRDQYFKQSVAAIQKITSMDLSLDQNVQQALQVFSPLYNDKSLLHDMGYTKKSMENFSSLESLKSCVGENCPGKYWDQGAQFIQYKMEEYKNASADQALLMSAPDAVPMIDVMKRAYELAKEFKPVVQETPQGMYIVTKKNGQLVQVPLYEHYKALIGEDPAVKKMYAVDAYVERENFVRSSEAQGISREEANSIYAREKYEGYQLMIDDAKKNSETQGTSLQNQLDQINNFLKNQPNITESHPLVQTKQNLEEQIQINEVNRRSVTQIADDINSGYKTVTPSGISSGQTGPQYTPQGADAIVAYYKMNRDFLDAAIQTSALGAEIKVKADPVALARMREAGANARAQYREEQAWKRLEEEQKIKQREKEQEALNLNMLQMGTEELSTEFPDEDKQAVDYAKTVTQSESTIKNTQIATVNNTVKYLNEVAQSNTPDAATAKVILNKIKQNREATKTTGLFAINPVLEAIDPLKIGNEGLLKTKLGQQLVQYAGNLRNIDQSIKSAQVDLSKTKAFNKRVLDATMRTYEESSNSWIENLGEVAEGLKGAPLGAGAVFGAVGWLLKPSEKDKQARETESTMLKQTLLDSDGGLRSPQEIAKDMNLKFGKDLVVEVDQGVMQGRFSGLGALSRLPGIVRALSPEKAAVQTVLRNGKLIQVPVTGGIANLPFSGDDGINPTRVYYNGQLIFEGKTNLTPDRDENGKVISFDTDVARRNPNASKNKELFFLTKADQAFKSLNATAAEMVSDPQIGLKISPSSPMTSGLGVFATGVDGKLAVNNFKIAGEYKQTPTNMSFFEAFQKDISSVLKNVDQEVIGSPKVSIGYDPKELADENELKVIKEITKRLYSEAIDPDSKQSFQIAPLLQIAGSVDKRGYMFTNISDEIINSTIKQLNLSDETAVSIKDKLTTQGFTLYGDADAFTSSLFQTYNVDPRYNLFASNKDDKGRPFYQENNRRGDAELNIQFDPVYQGYTATVDYTFFDPIKQVYKTNTITNPVLGNVVTNGAQFSQLLRQYDDMMDQVTMTNIKAIISPESVIPQ